MLLFFGPGRLLWPSELANNTGTEATIPGSQNKKKTVTQYRHPGKLTLFLLGLLLSPALLAATDKPPKPDIHHRLTISKPSSHLLEVASTFPSNGPTLELMMAVWTPGSYLVREFSRQVEQFRAVDQSGRPLAVRKSSKNRWLIETNGNSPVSVRYTVYARELSVRTSFIDSEFALLNGASIFMVPVAGLDLAHGVSLDLPDQWSDALSSMPRVRRQFVASHFDHLVDSPIVAGSPSLSEFKAGGVNHQIVHIGDTRWWDLDKAAADVATLVSRQYLFWGSFPDLQPYLFMNLIVEAGGGLEHGQSTVLMTKRYQMLQREDYLKWLGLVSHEYFHRWNVKSMRPHGLGPFDYENEQYTDGLWVAEGLTSYYSRLMLTRAGLMLPQEYFKELAKQIRNLALKPGQRVRSVEQASFDAWIKHYRPDENSINTAVSYYNKGALIGFLLDAWIREASQGKANLDDLMRRAQQQYSGEAGFTAADIRTLASELAGSDMNSWFDQFVSGTAPLEYGQALDWYGLELVQTKESAEKEDTAKAFEDPPRSAIGAKVEAEDGRLLVKEVRRGSAAFTGGINAGDEIIAVDEVRVESDQWKDLFARLRVGQQVEIMVARRGRMMTLQVELQPEVAKEWQIRKRKDISPAQARRLAEWLGSGWFPQIAD
jgi:predicted metalloprotease with PDZ domain